MGERWREVQGEARELVPFQRQDPQLAETPERPGLDGTDSVVLQIQAGEVSELPQGACSDVSDTVLLQQQGLQTGRQATREAGQQVVTETELLEAGERSEQVVHVAELVPGHGQS